MKFLYHNLGNEKKYFEYFEREDIIEKITQIK